MGGGCDRTGTGTAATSDLSFTQGIGVPRGPVGLDGALPDVGHPPQDLLVPTARGEPSAQAGVRLWGHSAAPAPEDLCRAPSELPQPRSWRGGRVANGRARGRSGDLSPKKTFLSLFRLLKS